jgi:hypothetical protein
MTKLFFWWSLARFLLLVKQYEKAYLGKGNRAMDVDQEIAREKKGIMKIANGIVKSLKVTWLLVKREFEKI